MFHGRKGPKSRHQCFLLIPCSYHHQDIRSLLWHKLFLSGIRIVFAGLCCHSVPSQKRSRTISSHMYACINRNKQRKNLFTYLELLDLFVWICCSRKKRSRLERKVPLIPGSVLVSRLKNVILRQNAGSSRCK